MAENTVITAQDSHGQTYFIIVQPEQKRNRFLWWVEWTPEGKPTQKTAPQTAPTLKMAIVRASLYLKAKIATGMRL